MSATEAMPAKGAQYLFQWAGCSPRVSRLRARRAHYWQRFLEGDEKALHRHSLAHLLIGRIHMREYVAAKRRAA